MRVLVTGGAGYIGSVVATRLLEDGHEVVVLDDLSTGHEDAVPPGAELVVGRVHDAAAEVVARLRPDAVAHLAASSLVAESVADPAKYEENNVIGTERLLAAMRAGGVERIVFSSSAAVYGEPEQVPIPEDAACHPLNPYGASKLAMDRALAAAAVEGLAAVSLRFFNVAGAYAGRGERHRTETHLVPIALEVALGLRSDLAIFGKDYPTPDGTCVRDYVHVADIAEAHLRALAVATVGRHEVVNLGNGNGFSVLEVVAAVEQVTGRRLPVRVEARREGDPAVLVASARRAGEVLGWRPARPSLEAMVADAWAVRRARSSG